MHIHKRLNGVVYNTKTATKIYERGGETLWTTPSTDMNFITAGGAIIPLDTDKAGEWIQRGFPHDTPKVAKDRLSMKSADKGKHANPWMDSVGLAVLPTDRATERVTQVREAGHFSIEASIEFSPHGELYFRTDDPADIPLVYQAIYDTSLSFKIFEFGGETLWRLDEPDHPTFLVNGGTITPLDLDEATTWVQRHFRHDHETNASERISLKSTQNPPAWADSLLLVRRLNGRNQPPITFAGHVQKNEMEQIETLLKLQSFSKSAAIHQGDWFDYFTTDDENDITMFKFKFNTTV